MSVVVKKKLKTEFLVIFNIETAIPVDGTESRALKTIVYGVAMLA